MTVFETRASAVLYNLFAGPGDAGVVLLPAIICPIVPIVLRKAGRRFEFVDIDAATLAIDRDRVLARIRRSPATIAGLVFVRPYGALDDQEPFFAEVKSSRRDVLLVDDRCLCLPEPDGPDPTAPKVATRTSRADVVLYSTGPKKVVDLGFGGFAHLGGELEYRRHELPYSTEAADEIERLHQLARENRQRFAGDGGAWLDLAAPATPWAEYRAALLARRTEAVARRSVLNQIYSRALPEGIQLAEGYHGWRFHIRVPDPDGLVRRLAASGLFAGRHYPPPTGLFTDERFPVAAGLHASITNLFNDLPYDADAALRTADVVQAHLKHQRA